MEHLANKTDRKPKKTYKAAKHSVPLLEIVNPKSTITYLTCPEDPKIDLWLLNLVRPVFVFSSDVFSSDVFSSD